MQARVQCSLSSGVLALLLVGLALAPCGVGSQGQVAAGRASADRSGNVAGPAGTPGRGGDAKARKDGPTVEVEAGQKAPVESWQVLDMAAKAVANAQGQLFAVQTVGGILAVLLGLAGAVNLHNSVKFGRDLGRIRSEMQALDAQRRVAVAEVAALREASQVVRDSLHELQVQAGLLKTIAEFGMLSDDGRLLALQKLSQHVHPLAIPAMTGVLLDSSCSDALRVEAAYGLGRFVEKGDTSGQWPAILGTFRAILSNDRSPMPVVQEVAKSAMLFGAPGAALLGLAAKRFSSAEHPNKGQK